MQFLQCSAQHWHSPGPPNNHYLLVAIIIVISAVRSSALTGFAAAVPALGGTLKIYTTCRNLDRQQDDDDGDYIFWGLHPFRQNNNRFRILVNSYANTSPRPPAEAIALLFMALGYMEYYTGTSFYKLLPVLFVERRSTG